MQLAKDVHVYGRNGRFLYRRHKAKAEKLVSQSGATCMGTPKAVQLPQIPYAPIGKPSNLRAACLGGQPIAGDSMQEPGLPNTWSFRWIHPDDRALFIGPVLECLRMN